MAINLVKGQKIDITKGNSGLSKLRVGLGWDAAAKKGLFGMGGANIDCDASVILLDANGKVISGKSTVYFGNLRSPDGSIQHMGDNLTGDGDGDDEVIKVDLNRVSQDIHKLIFVVNIYQCVSRRQDFGMIKNAFIRILDDSKNAELVKFNLTDNYAGSTGLIVGELYRHNGDWKFNAIGQGTRTTSLTEMVNEYK